MSAASSLAINRLVNAPIALAPAGLPLLLAALEVQRGATRRRRPARAAMVARAEASASQETAAPALPFALVDGVAVVPVQGVLLQRTGTAWPIFGCTGYDGIRAALLAALAHHAVKAIALDIDSPGGEVAGCFDLADLIFAARARKPIWAILTETAASAAYALAAAAERVVIPRTGLAGSIGIVVAHVDLSAALSEAGIKVTLISYGARKTDGAETAPLSDEARRRFQADVDTLGGLFVSSVARCRGVDPEAIRGQEAAVYRGADAIAAGLADVVMPPSEAFAALREAARRPPPGPVPVPVQVLPQQAYGARIAAAARAHRRRTAGLPGPLEGPDWDWLRPAAGGAHLGRYGRG